jgi:hypothetical protein
MKRLIVLGLVCAFSFCLHAQVVDTTVCEVLKNPTSFNGKTVRIKGTVASDFDQFAVQSGACGLKVNAIWLSYPEGAKAKSGPAALLQLQPASNFAGTVAAEQRAPVTLDKSKDFKQFDSLLATPSKGGGMCLGCGRYEVSATLVGRLDGVAKAGVQRDKAGKIVGISGFGNMNEYSARLVLQSVSDVSSKEIDYSKALAAAKDAKDDGEVGSGSSSDAQEANRKAVKAFGETTAAGQSLSRACDAFGAVGAKSGVNGVILSSGALNEAAAKDEAKAPRDSPDGVLYNVGINNSRVQGDAMVRAYAHMGQHVADLRNPEKGFELAGPFELEFRAWNVTLFSAAAYGQKTLTLPGGALLWNVGWPAGERNNAVMGALRDFLNGTELLGR